MKSLKLFLFFALGLVLFSCNKESLEVENLSTQNLSTNINDETIDIKQAAMSPSFYSEYYHDGLGLELSDMELIGRLHNEYALVLENEMDLSCENCGSEFNDVLTSFLKSEFEDLNARNGNYMAEVIVDESLSDAVELKHIDFDFTKWNDNYMSASFNLEYQKIVDLIYTANSIDEMNTELDDFINIVSTSSFSTFEKEALITGAEVARNSFKLWAPVSMKGLGYLSAVNGIEGPVGDPNSRWCWRCAAGGDLAGVTTFFLTLGVAASVTAAAVPGANVVLAVGVAGAAIGGSVAAGSGIFNP